MRIFHCIATMKGGGAEKQLCYLVKGQIDRGIEVHVIIIEEGINYDLLVATDAYIHKIKVDGFYSFKIYRIIKNLINLHKPDIVQCWQRPMDLFASLAAFFSNTPFVTSERTNPRKYIYSFKGLLRLVVVQLSSAIIANSEAGKDFWKTRMIMNKKNVYFIPNILPFSFIEKANRTNEFENYLISVGRLAKEKNHDLLIYAFAKAMFQKINLIIVGEGPEYHNLNELIINQNLSHRIFLINYRRDIFRLLKGSCGFVSLSTHEGMPNAVLEAAACNIPILLSDIPEHRNIFFSSEVSFCSISNIEMAAESLKNFFVMKKEQSYSNLEKYSEEYIVNEYNLIYNKILLNG